MVEIIQNIDKSLLLLLNGDMGRFADSVFWVISGRLTWIPLYLLILYGIYKRTDWRTLVAAMIFIGLAVVLADQFCNIFKYGFKKFRPTHTPDIEMFVHTVNGYVGGLYGTFSAHAATAFAIALFTSKFFKNTIYTISIFFWAILISYSRIYLGVHFPLDLFFGTLTGLGFGWLSYKTYSSKFVSKFYRL